MIYQVQIHGDSPTKLGIKMDAVMQGSVCFSLGLQV